MAKVDLDCANFDPANGQLRDLVDSYAYGQLVRDAEAGDYLTAIATPDCNTFPSRRGPGCPPPLRGMTGSDRYGFKANTPANSETCRLQNIYHVRVAGILALLTGKRIPWLLGVPRHHSDLVSALDLDEYVTLLAMQGVSTSRGVQ